MPQRPHAATSRAPDLSATTPTVWGRWERPVNCAILPDAQRTARQGGVWMKPILRISRYLVVVTVVGCIVMFGGVTIYAALAVGGAILKMLFGGSALTDIAAVTAAAFKIL